MIRAARDGTFRSRSVPAEIARGSFNHAFFKALQQSAEVSTGLADGRGGVLDLAPKDSELDLEVAREILRYFRRNPEAADTVEGVARWRLLDERIHRNLEVVARVMAWLVARGLLIEEPIAHSGVVFRLNKEQRREIERFLQDAAIEEQEGKK